MATVALFTIDGEITAVKWSCATWSQVTSLRRLGWERGTIVGHRTEERQLAFVEILSCEPELLTEIVIDLDLVIPLCQDGWASD